MDNSVIAALISGFIALVGVVISFWANRSQNRLHEQELALKQSELDSASRQLKAEFEALRQTQFTEILRKRVEGYPQLWSILVKYTTNWRLSYKPRDTNWANDFLSEINDCNEKWGVFFSQGVYEKFFDLRTLLAHICREYGQGRVPDSITLEKPDEIFIGSNSGSGLAAYLKDDLGSYRSSVIQTRTQ